MDEPKHEMVRWRIIWTTTPSDGVQSNASDTFGRSQRALDFGGMVREMAESVGRQRAATDSLASIADAPFTPMVVGGCRSDGVGVSHEVKRTCSVSENSLTIR